MTELNRTLRRDGGAWQIPPGVSLVICEDPRALDSLDREIRHALLRNAHSPPGSWVPPQDVIPAWDDPADGSAHRALRRMLPNEEKPTGAICMLNEHVLRSLAYLFWADRIPAQTVVPFRHFGSGVPVPTLRKLMHGPLPEQAREGSLVLMTTDRIDMLFNLREIYSDPAVLAERVFVLSPDGEKMWTLREAHGGQMAPVETAWRRGDLTGPVAR